MMQRHNERDLIDLNSIRKTNHSIQPTHLGGVRGESVGHVCYAYHVDIYRIVLHCYTLHCIAYYPYNDYTLHVSIYRIVVYYYTSHCVDFNDNQNLTNNTDNTIAHTIITLYLYV